MSYEILKNHFITEMSIEVQITKLHTPDFCDYCSAEIGKETHRLYWILGKYYNLEKPDAICGILCGSCLKKFREEQLSMVKKRFEDIRPFNDDGKQKTLC